MTMILKISSKSSIILPMFCSNSIIILLPYSQVGKTVRQFVKFSMLLQACHSILPWASDVQTSIKLRAFPAFRTLFLSSRLRDLLRVATPAGVIEYPRPSNNDGAIVSVQTRADEGRRRTATVYLHAPVNMGKGKACCFRS